MKKINKFKKKRQDIEPNELQETDNEENLEKI